MTYIASAFDTFAIYIGLLFTSYTVALACSAAYFQSKLVYQRRFLEILDQKAKEA